MSIELKEKSPNDLPKAIFIAGEEVGEVSPTNFSGKLGWHSVIDLKNLDMVCHSLVQGHGSTPQAAIAASIVAARIERDAFIEQLAKLEFELGTTGKTPAELQALT